MSFALYSKVSTYNMDTIRLHNELRLIPVHTNSSCSLADALPSELSVAVTPLIAWTLLVLFGTLVPQCIFSGLSIQRSLKELFLERHSRLDVLDVLRVLAIFWVMINHTGSEGRIDILDRLPSAESFKRAVHEHPVFGPFLGNSALGVEIFLVLSGLLAARSWLRAADQPFFAHYRQFITRRILRLIPSILFFVYIAAGPIMKTLLPRYHSSMISTCGIRGILSHVTFLGNWQSTPTCMGYLWYLGLDMQLYMAAPFLLQLLHKQTRLAIATFIGLIAMSGVIRAAYCTAYGVCNNSDVDIPFISYPGQDPATLSKIYGGLWEMYARPYTKCGPFLLGLLLGYINTVAMPKLELSNRASNALIGSGSALAVATVYAILPEYWYPDQGNTLYNTLYTASFRTVFAFAICAIIFGVVYRRESMSVSTWWSVLARLTYNAYLLHMPIIYIFNFLPFLQTAAGPYELLAVLPFVAFLSFTAATVFYLFVEAPLGHITSQWAAKHGC